MTPHLVIGLGGTGCYLVGAASRVLSGRGRVNPGAPLVSLAIDTDPAGLTALEGAPCQSYLLPMASVEKLLLNPGERPSLRKHIVPGLKPSERRDGAGMLRAVGRLAFLNAHEELSEYLARTLDGLLRQPGPLRLSILAAPGGGTGGALLCELAYLIVELLESRKPGSTVLSEALLGTSPRPGRGPAAANAFAALTELNHWMAPDTSYSAPALSDEAPWETGRPPFSRVSLFHARDLADPADRDSVASQITAYLGLSSWPAFGPLSTEVVRRQEAFDNHCDDYGNPLCYFSPGYSSLSLPFDEIRSALAARLLHQVVERWRGQLYRKAPAGEGEQAAAIEFLHRAGLARHVILQGLGEAAGGTEAFRLDQAVAAIREELERKPLYGASLTNRLREFDHSMVAIMDNNSGQGVGSRIERKAAEALEQGSRALSDELRNFFRTDHTGSPGYCVYLDQLSNALGDRLRTLYEQLSQLEVDDLRLQKEKEQAFAQAVTSDPGVLDRMLRRRKALTPAAPVLEVVERYHANRLQIHVHREAWNVFQGLRETLERFRSEMSHLVDYLGRLARLLAEEQQRCLGQVFSVPGEVLLSLGEVEDFLNERCRAEAVDEANGWVLEGLEADLLELPARMDPGQALSRMMELVVERLGGLEGIDVLEQFFHRYRGEAAHDQLRLLFGKARPSLIPTLQLEGFTPIGSPEVAYAAVHGGVDSDEPHRRKLAAFLSQLPGAVPLSVVGCLSGERLAFFRMVGAFPLRAVDLGPMQLAYHAELKQARPLHIREDVPWRSPARPSPRERARILETVAVALHLGHVEPGPAHQPPPQVASARWPDIGPVKACLARYAELHEALQVEQNFLDALSKWQEGKLDELGAEAYIRLLELPGQPLELLGRDFSDALRRASQRLLRQMQDQWPEWDALVAGYLQQAPTLSEPDLVQIPSGFRRWVMQRYVDEHPSDNLSYHPSTARLEIVSAADLSRLEQLWRRLQDAAQEGTAEEFAEQTAEVVTFFCKMLGFTTLRPLGHACFQGLAAGTHGLRIRIPATVPILVAQKPSLTGEDVESLRSALEQVGLDNRFAMLLTPGDVAATRRAVEEGLSSLLRYDVIVLDYEHLRNILRSRNRLYALVARILEQVDLTVVSPFVTEGPVPPSMFFGREGEIKEIQYRLDNTNVALIGPRRIGKTSVLQRVLSSLRKAERPVCYLDCQSLSRAEDLLASLAAEHLSDWSPRGHLNFPLLLQELLSRSRGNQALIILDEVDLVLSQDHDGSELLGRAFRQATTDGRARFLFCGERTLHHRLHEPDAALYNLCHPMRLGFLDPRDASKLILEPMEQMELRWEDVAWSLDRILQVTAGHPNLIQRACTNLVDRLNQERTREIQRELLDQVLDDPAFAEEYLETLWGSSGMRERIVTLVIQEGEDITAPDLRRRLATDHAVTVSLHELVESLDNLCLYGVLERHGTRYRFAVASFPGIVRNTMDVPEAVELYKEMMLDGS